MLMGVSPWCVISALPAHRDKQDRCSHSRLFAPSSTACACADCGTNDVLHLPAHVVAGTEKVLWWGSSRTGEGSVRQACGGTIGLL